MLQTIFAHTSPAAMRHTVEEASWAYGRFIRERRRGAAGTTELLVGVRARVRWLSHATPRLRMMLLGMSAATGHE